jgi:hypothetical protein
MQMQIVKTPKISRIIYYFYNVGILFGEKCAPNTESSATNAYVGFGMLVLIIVIKTSAKGVFYPVS